MDSSIPASATGGTPTARVWVRLRRRPLAWFSGGTIVLLLVTALAAPWLADRALLDRIGEQTLAAPSAADWLGTDDLGRSLWPQLLWGARVSLSVGILSALAATALGVLIGSVAGYVGGRVDSLLMRVTEFFQVMPTFVLAALIVSLVGPGESRVMAVISLLAWPDTARLVRGEVLKVSQLHFVEAARCLGVPEHRILLFEVVPNAIGPVIALSTLTAAYAILLEASLSYFGLTSPDVVSWGHLLSTGQRFIHQAWWMSAFAGLAIFVTALAFNLFGDCVREALNPRSKEA